MEPFPDRFLMPAIIRQSFLRVVELVGGRDQSNRRIRAPQVTKIGLLPFQPGRLRQSIGIGAGFDDPCNARPKLAADLLEARLAALVLDPIGKKSSDGFVLIASLGEDDRGNAEQMADIRASGTFAELRAVGSRRVNQRLIEAWAERALTLRNRGHRFRHQSRLRSFDSRRKISK